MKKFWLCLTFALLLLSGACTFPFSSGSSPTPAVTGAESTAQTTPATRVSTAWPIPTKRPTTTPRPTSSPQPTKTPRPTKTSPPPTPTVTPIYPVEGYGPIHFPADVNPLTGWQIRTPALLDRRPVIVKVENLPRADRPQWGLSSADTVYEYYTELGTTRFAAIYYGQDAAQVGPVRSARLFDISLIRMYRGMFAFGGAYQMILQRLFGAEFARQLVLESASACPPLCRLDAGGANYLFADTSAVNAYASARGIDNTRQLLNGTVFQTQAPAQGKVAEKIYTRFSGSIYNRWDYDPKNNRYERFVDQQDDVNRNNEVYGRLIDRANNNPITADNLVILLAPHSYVVKTNESEILDISLTGDGAAFLFRDGKSYLGIWKRPAVDALPFLVREDGSALPFKPGNTWYEMMGVTSKLDIQNETWRFVFSIP